MINLILTRADVSRRLAGRVDPFESFFLCVLVVTEVQMAISKRNGYDEKGRSFLWY